MIDHRVCLLQLHVKGRPPRPAVRTGETGKSKRTSTGWNRARYGMGTPDSSGTGRKQAMDAMTSQGSRNAFSAKAFLVEAGKRTPFHASQGKKESNHGLNDKPENPWYPDTSKRENPLFTFPRRGLETETGTRAHGASPIGGRLQHIPKAHTAALSGRGSPRYQLPPFRKEARSPVGN